MDACLCIHGLRLQPWLVSSLMRLSLLPAAAHLGQLSIWLGVPAAALLGSVIYADILLLIPIGFALIQHGASVPVVLTFMIAASGLNLQAGDSVVAIIKSTKVMIGKNV